MRGALAAALAGVLLAAAAAASPARQDPDAKRKARQQADLMARREAKLAEAWLADGGWITDYDRAREAAAAGKKLIVGYFTCSFTASKGCEQMENGVLSSGEFREFARDVVLFAHVTSRVEGEKHGDLLLQKGGKSFPHVVAMDAGGEVLSTLPGRTVDGFRAMMKDAAAYRDLRGKKDPTPGERLRLLRMDLDRGLLKTAEYRERAGALQGLDEAAAKEREAGILHVDILDQLERFRGATGPDPELRLEVGGIFAGMKKAGRIPTDKDDLGAFCEMMLDYAESTKDADLFEFCFSNMRRLYGEQKRLESAWKYLQERLDRIRKDGAGKGDGKTEEKKDGKTEGKPDGKPDGERGGKAGE